MQIPPEVPAVVLEMEAAIKSLARRLGIREPDRIFQDVCVHCWRRHDLLTRCQNPAAWILTVARNAANAAHRQDRRCLVGLPEDCDTARRPRGSEAATPSETAEVKEVRRAVRKAVERLPPLYREVIIACDLDGESLEKFAFRIGCKF